MNIGIPTEIKNNEKRVSFSPSGVKALVSAGHKVLVEQGAGETAGFVDEQYIESGATIVPTASEAWSADMVIKVKEPLKEEFDYLREGLILFTYLHLAANKELTEVLAEKGVTAIGYETMVGQDGSLPLLTPMSQIAGRMSVQIGAHYLENSNGGKGILLGGTPGVRSGKVVIIGGGVSGTNAAKIAVGMGANVVVLDNNPARLSELGELFGNSIQTIMSNEYNIEEELKTADLVIGAVLIPGAKAPQLVSEKMVKQMTPGSVIVDISVDQGGIIETADRVTTLADPVYEKHGVLHYAVANIPGSVAKTATQALTNVTTPYAVAIANKGVVEAAKENSTIYTGINVMNNQVTHKEVAQSLGIDFISASRLF